MNSQPPHPQAFRSLASRPPLIQEGSGEESRQADLWPGRSLPVQPGPRVQNGQSTAMPLAVLARGRPVSNSVSASSRLPSPPTPGLHVSSLCASAPPCPAFIKTRTETEGRGKKSWVQSVTCTLPGCVPGPPRWTPIPLHKHILQVGKQTCWWLSGRQTRLMASGAVNCEFTTEFMNLEEEFTSIV